MLHDEIRKFSVDRKDNLIKEKINDTAIITFNRPKHLNCLSNDISYRLIRDLHAYEHQYDTKLVILKGQGNKAFSAGGDIADMFDAIKIDPVPLYFHQVMDDGYRIFHKISTMKTPVISLLDGFVIGFGAGIALCSKFRIATENTTAIMPETLIGHFVDSSTSYFLSHLKDYYGRYFALCAMPIKGEDIMATELATHYVPSSKLSAMIQHLTQLESPSNKDIDAAINQFAEKYPTKQELLFVDVSRERRHEIIVNCFKFDTVEEIVAALQDEGSEFSKQAAKRIVTASPTASKISLELLRRASTMSLEQCLILERRLWNLDMESHDFLEGCKAKMKKQTPRWSPGQLKEVDLQTDICLRRFDKAQLLKPVYLGDMASFLENSNNYGLPNNIIAEHAALQQYKSSL